MIEDRAIAENWYRVGPFGNVQSTRVNLAGSQFSGATMANADFKQNLLTGADFSGAVLVSANFEDAQLEDALMRAADLESANFERADLRGADFSFANLETARLVGAMFDERTMLPFSREVAEDRHKMIYQGELQTN